MIKLTNVYESLPLLSWPRRN